MSWAPPNPPPGFLDAASGEPIHPAAAAAWATAQREAWADPTKLHHLGRRAAIFLAAAREEVAGALEVGPGAVTFTTSASAALRLAVARLAQSHPGSAAITSSVEHSAVTAALAGWTGPVQLIGVDRSGRIDVDSLVRDAPGAGLVLLQSANHEVGTRQPIREIVSLLPGVPLLLDASASLGQEPIPAGWTLMVASARKWGGPPGIGLLVDRRREDVAPFAGEPPDVPGAVAAAASLTAVMADQVDSDSSRRRLVDRLRAELACGIPDLEIVGDAIDRLPHIVNVSCLYVDGEALVGELDRAGFAVSSGSACASTAGSPSHVLAAMGVLTHGNIRVSLPHGVDPADVDRFIEVLPGIVDRLRNQLPG